MDFQTVHSRGSKDSPEDREVRRGALDVSSERVEGFGLRAKGPENLRKHG